MRASHLPIEKRQRAILNEKDEAAQAARKKTTQRNALRLRSEAANLRD